jgi:multiple sugar transport system substrate-binding protein
MTTTDGQVKTATTFAYYIPPTAAGQQQLLAQKPDLKAWVDAVKSAKGRTSDNLGTDYPKISQAMWTGVQKALSGSLSPKDALVGAQQAALKATR